MGDMSDKEIHLNDKDRPESQRTLTPSAQDGVSTMRVSNDEEAAKHLGQEDTHVSDPNVVGWDGPDDPACPMNWPEKKKWTNIVAISIMTLLT